MTDHLENLLASLDEGAPADAFAAQLDASPLSPDARRRLASLHTKLQGSRRREELLRVLHDTATDLTGIRDVEAILQAITARTRQLLGTDMAYISLNDYERGETFIRKSDGVVTPEYRSIRMPLGTGVLGKVATGLSPVSVVDYLSERGIVHLHDIDAIVHGEGVHSIMGVPLTVRGRVIGALLVAERSRRRFTAEEIDIIDSLGKQAAVALDNAQRFAEVTDALARLDAQHHSRRAELTQVQELLDLDETLIEVIVRGSGYSGLLDAAGRVLPYPIVIVHPDGRTLASFDPRPDAAPGWFARVTKTDRAAIAATTRGVQVTGRAQVARRGSMPRPYTVAAALAGDEKLATVVVGTGLNAPQRSILDRIAVFCTLVRLFDRAAQAQDIALQAEVVDDLVSGRLTDPHQVAGRLERFGLLPGHAVTVALIQGEPAVAPLARVRASLRGQPAIAVGHADHICVIASSDDPLSAIVDDEAPLRVSYSVAEGFSGIADAHRQAHIGLVTLAELQRWDVLDARTLGASGLVISATQGSLRDVLAPIQPLLDYDERHRTGLTRTALVFLDSDGVAADAASLLVVHRNTVAQRLARIGVLLGEDWHRSPRRLDVHLALRVWQMSEHG